MLLTQTVQREFIKFLRVHCTVMHLPFTLTHMFVFKIQNQYNGLLFILILANKMLIFL